MEPSADTSPKELNEFISGHIQESVQINSPVTELLERSFLWLTSSSDIGIHIRLIIIQIKSISFKMHNLRKELADD